MKLAHDLTEEYAISFLVFKCLVHFLHMFQDEPFVPFTDEDEDSVDHALGGRNRFGSLSSLHKQ